MRKITWLVLCGIFAIGILSIASTAKAGGPVYGWSTGMFRVQLQVGQNGCRSIGFGLTEHCRIIGVRLPFNPITGLRCPRTNPTSGACYYITYNGVAQPLTYRDIVNKNPSDHFWGVPTSWVWWDGSWRFNLVSGTSW